MLRWYLSLTPNIFQIGCGHTVQSRFIIYSNVNSWRVYNIYYYSRRYNDNLWFIVRIIQNCKILLEYKTSWKFVYLFHLKRPFFTLSKIIKVKFKKYEKWIWLEKKRKTWPTSDTQSRLKFGHSEKATKNRDCFKHWGLLRKPEIYELCKTVLSCTVF